jgi:hypothetical protein
MEKMTYKSTIIGMLQSFKSTIELKEHPSSKYLNRLFRQVKSLNLSAISGMFASINNGKMSVIPAKV